MTLRTEALAATAANTVATGAGAFLLIGLTPMAWVCAFTGTMLSYYFYPEQSARKALVMLFGILASTFAAALIAVALPAVTWFGVGTTAGAIPPEVRAGLLGLCIRFVLEQAKRFATNKVREPSP